jgi:hypothetical protein
MTRTALVVASAALAACNGSKGGSGASGGGGDVPVVTARGAPVGSPVAQAMAPGGGGTLAEPGTGASVRVVDATFADTATVTVQPVMDLLPSGVGTGIVVTTTQPLQKPLLVQFPYAPEEDDPGSLRLVAQADDGTWLELYPVGVDTAAHTVTAPLPATLAAAPSALTAGDPGRQAAALNQRPVLLERQCELVPDHATVKTGAQKTFTPMCWVGQSKVCPELICDPGAPDSCYLDLSQECMVFSQQPLLNSKAGYIRVWTVLPSDPVNGTVQATGTVGGAYTAPSPTPNPNVVKVQFQSTLIADPRQTVKPTATVTIVPDHYHVDVKFTGIGEPVCVFGCADIADEFSFDLSLDGQSAKNFVNMATAVGNVTSCGAGGTVTLNGAFELGTADSIDQTLTGPDGAIFIGVLGTSTPDPGCVWTINGAPVTDSGGPSQRQPLIDFSFKPTDFHGNVLVLPELQISAHLVADISLAQ